MAIASRCGAETEIKIDTQTGRGFSVTRRCRLGSQCPLNSPRLFMYNPQTRGTEIADVIDYGAPVTPNVLAAEAQKLEATIQNAIYFNCPFVPRSHPKIP